MSGHVYAPDGTPVPHADVLFEVVGQGEPYQMRQETNGDGRFLVLLQHSSLKTSLRLTITKAGFQPYVSELTSSDAHRMIEEKHELMVVLDDGAPE